MADLPTGTVTFLFTDIEGSTPLWEREPDQMRLALARHDAILRTSIANHGGHAFKTIGDAFQAAFAVPAPALTAALAAQRAFATQTWETSAPIRVPMGLHTGVAIAEGNDYSTTHTLNRVARIMAAGHGGQILLSREVADLVRRDLPTNVTLRDMGTHRMKGLTHLEHLFQLVAPDLPATFPPLKTLDHHPNNLPLQPTLLIGREQEVASACALLCRPDVRLLTLTGPGGTGKTRLALQIAAELPEDFAGGVYFVALAPIGDPALVLSAIVQTLGLRESSGKSLLDGLKDYLREKRRLLLLDNFEQVVAAAPLVAELLAAAPHLKVLVTSRAALHLSGEREVAVPPLALPDRAQLPPLEQLTQYEAVRLFIARAQAVRADFAVTNENAPAVAEICHQLDGLPLAIELAAARIKMFLPQALLARLGNRLKLLTGGARDLPQRQQTIRDAIGWSYDLLNGGEQALFARLGVFVGGWTLESAEAVYVGVGGWGSGAGGASPTPNSQLPTPILDELASLLDKSLLKQTEGVEDEPRFMMLETIREYALERLSASGEDDAVRRRHALYYLALAETAETVLHGPQQAVWLERLAQEYDNMVAALNWFGERGDVEQSWRLGAALYPFWEMRGYLAEGYMRLVKLLALAAADVHAGVRTAARAKVLTSAGWLALHRDDFANARSLFAESLAIQRELGEALGIAAALTGLAYAVRFQEGDYAHAEALFEESLALFQAEGNQQGSALALQGMGRMARDQGDFKRADERFAKSLTLFQQVGDRRGRAILLIAMGEAARLQGDYAQAAALYDESIALFRERGDKLYLAVVLQNLGHVALNQGDPVQGAARLVESLVLWRDLGSPPGGIAGCLLGLGGVAAAQQQGERAARLFGAAEALWRPVDVVLEPADRADSDHYVAAARAQFPEASFAAAWAAGQALSLEQAIAYALESPPAVTPPAPPLMTPQPISSS